MPEKEMLVGICPECGSQNLEEISQTTTFYPILSWKNFEPDEYREPTRTESSWVLADGETYHCPDCCHQFETPEFVTA